jgi:hypothetical protein
MQTLTSPEEYRQFRTEDCHHSEDVAKIVKQFFLKKISSPFFPHFVTAKFESLRNKTPFETYPERKHSIFYSYNFQESTFSLGNTSGSCQRKLYVEKRISLLFSHEISQKIF